MGKDAREAELQYDSVRFASRFVRSDVYDLAVRSGIAQGLPPHTRVRHQAWQICREPVI